MCGGECWATVTILLVQFRKRRRKSVLFVGKGDFMLSVFAGFLAHALEESLLRGCFHFLV